VNELTPSDPGPPPTLPHDLERHLSQLWQQGQRPDVHRLLAESGDLRPQQVAAILAVDLRERWRAGERVAVEDYLRAYPAVQADVEAALELVYGEVLLRDERGEAPAPDEYLRRFPQYSARLQEQFQLHQALAMRPALGAGAVTVLADGLATGAAETRALPAVPGYEVLGELGRGGMGVVFRARQTSLNRIVALKMLLAGRLASAAEAQRFRSEALAVARLQHPNVVQIHEVGEHQGHPYFALEFVAGGSLADRLCGGPLPPRLAAELLETLARAVQVAHENGVVHRDLKPANILLSAEGTPKIADFGLAKRLDAQTAATQTGTVLGTPAYMAPEQAGGKVREVGPAADVWALGALLYECLTGRPPFSGPTPTDTLLRVLSDEPPPPRKLNPAVPRDLETIALKCLRKQSHRRYASAAELADDLRRFLQGEPIRARPRSLAERLWHRRRRLRATGLALLVLVLLGVGTYALLGWRQERQDNAAFDEALARGMKQFDDGKATEAVASFTEALRLRPDSLALTQRGTVYGTLGDNNRALADFAEALRLNPENALAYRRRGWVFLTLRRYEDAVADLSKSTRLDPDQALAWRLRASAYAALGRWSDAKADGDTAVRLAPDDVLAYHLLSIVHAAQGQWAEAVSDFDRSGPSKLNGLFTRAAAALASRDEAGYRQARDRILALAEAGGDGADASQAARVCALAEETDIDPSRLRRLIGDEPWKLPTPVLLMRIQALVWLRTGRLEEAVRQAEASLKSDSNYSPAISHLLLSIAHKKLGHSEEADRAFERALREPVPVQHVHETLEYQVLLREAARPGGDRARRDDP
jgi:tetratricopeptide (TPR) repeat protein